MGTTSWSSRMPKAGLSLIDRMIILMNGMTEAREAPQQGFPPLPAFPCIPGTAPPGPPCICGGLRPPHPPLASSARLLGWGWLLRYMSWEGILDRAKAKPKPSLGRAQARPRAQIKPKQKPKQTLDLNLSQAQAQVKSKRIWAQGPGTLSS